MEGLRQPVGDLPPEVYWRRRLVIVGGLLLLILVLWFLITSPSGGEGTGVTDSAIPSPTASPTTTAAASGSLAVGRECTEGDLEITTTPNPFTSDADSLPRFDVVIEHVGDSPCLLQTAHEDSELLIMSGSDRIWSSADCPDQSPINEREFLLEAGQEEDFQVTWPRTRSAPECATVTAEPAPGFYLADLSLQGIAAEQVQFELAD
ncbi:MAG: hypothetical protein WDZ57_00825 [Demequina sp.]